MRQNKLDKQQARSIFDFGNYAVFVSADIENCQIFVNVGVIKSLANVGKVLPNGLLTVLIHSRIAFSDSLFPAQNYFSLRSVIIRINNAKQEQYLVSRC